MAEAAATKDEPPEAPDKETPGRFVDRWIGIIQAREREQEDWINRGNAIVKRYRNESVARATDIRSPAQYAILWSNVQTLQEALYARLPKPECVRRYQDQDPIGRTAATIWERCLSYMIEDDASFDDVMKQVVQDRLLPGRGVTWERYVPVYGKERMPRTYLDPAPAADAVPIGGMLQAALDPNAAPPPADPQWLHPEGKPVDAAAIQMEGDSAYLEEGEPFKPVLSEESVTDYVYWQDFLMSAARNWQELGRGGWVKRNVYMTRDQLVDRFGEDIGRKVPLNYLPDGIEKKWAETHGEQLKKGLVWETWDSSKKEAFWISPDYKDGPLDRQPDPLRLKGFFPCAKPAFATTTNDTMTPVADYLEYQDQAMQIDDLTARIDLVIDAIKVACLYDGSIKADIGQILRPGLVKNIMIPVDNWAMFAERGGIKGSIDFLPIDQVVNALTAMFEAREKLKQDLYEITGMSDIVRGQNDPDSTATAERIKGRFASLRLGGMQSAIQKYIRDVIRIKAEIIAEHFSPDTIIEMSGYAYTQGADREKVMQAIQLLKNDKLRGFRIDIETDSTIAADEQEAQKQATDYVKAMGEFIKGAMPIVQEQPELLPLVSEMLAMVARTFQGGRSVEEALDKAMKALEAKAQQAQAAGPKPDPEMAKVQASAQIEQAKMAAQTQADQARMAMEAQHKQIDQQTALQAKQAELEVQKANDERDFAARQAELDKKAQTDREMALIEQDTRLKIAHIDAAARIEVARIGAKTDLGKAAYEMEATAAGEDPEAAEADEAAESPEPGDMPPPAVAINIHPPGMPPMGVPGA